MRSHSMLRGATALSFLFLAGAHGSCVLDMGSVACSSDNDCNGMVCCVGQCASVCLVDAGNLDAGMGDDAGTPDDAGAPPDDDAGLLDGGVDAGSPDDGGPVDAGDMDAGPMDAGPMDAGPAAAVVCTGDGTSCSFTGELETVTLAVGDFNQDGIPDLVKVGQTLVPHADGGDGVAFYYGSADGGLVEGPSLNYDPTIYGPWEVRAGAVADFNADGWPDLVVSGYAGTVQVVLNGGDGTFTREDLANAYSTYDVQVGDFNGDGLPDIAVCGWAGLLVYFNQGGAGFGSPVHLDPLPVAYTTQQEECIFQAVADFNGDGYADVVSTQFDESGPQLTASLVLHLAIGDGGFLAPTSNTAWLVSANWQGVPLALAAVDVNNDGLPDVVGPTAQATLAVLLNVDGGAFGPETETSAPGVDVGTLGQAPEWYWGVAVADLNGDGNVDVAVTAGTGYLTDGGFTALFLNGGTGSFLEGSVLPTTLSNPSRVTTWLPAGATLPSLVLGDGWNGDVYIYPNASLFPDAGG